MNKKLFNEKLKELKLLVVEEVFDASLDAIKDLVGNVDLKKASKLYGELSDSEWLYLIKKDKRINIVNGICKAKDIISNLIDLKDCICIYEEKVCIV